MAMRKDRRNLTTFGYFKLLLDAGSKRLLSAAALISPFETQQVLSNQRFLSQKARQNARCLPMKTIEQKSSKALFQNLWVKKQATSSAQTEFLRATWMTGWLQAAVMTQISIVTA
jgi:transposase